MGTGFGMVEERADALIQFGRDDVLELAGFGVYFRAANRKCICKKALGKTTAADDIARARSAAFR